MVKKDANFNQNYKPKNQNEHNSNRSKYRKLHDHYDDGGFLDVQFERPQKQVPWKAIGLASFLLIAGTCTILVACSIMSGHLNLKPVDSSFVLLLLGFVMFIPGFYHCRIAYYAFKSIPGYSYDDIPSFD